MITLKEAIDLLDGQSIRNLKPSLCGFFNPTIPKRLVQYWDEDPPAQIQSLLAHNKKLCARFGLDHVFYDTQAARRFLEKHYPPEMVALYERAPHPAIKSDLFRCAELAAHGGWYLDADMALRPNSPNIWRSSAPCVFFKWTEEKKRNVCNWFFGSRPKQPAMEHILDVISINLSFSLDNARSERDIIRNALNVAGPGRFTIAVAEWMRQESEGVFLAAVPQAYKIVMNGPDLLREPLGYKSTARHWLVAGK